MANEDIQNDLVVEVMALVERFQSGDFGPVKDRAEWEQLVASRPPEERELLDELARFVDLWRYLREHKEKLGPAVVNSLRQMGKLSIPERVAELKEINLGLMERVGNADPNTQLRN
jgi:hypothetical protein